MQKLRHTEFLQRFRRWHLPLLTGAGKSDAVTSLVRFWVDSGPWLPPQRYDRFCLDSRTYLWSEIDERGVLLSVTS